ncbi:MULTISPECIES: hypothetical protein [unclassified Mesorhizobium]|uniref:hypothetical protein n=1 Tax=unclassified Mesorhizobium TaxID=325217 RepID=UPI0003D037CD|nr:MULTISPECIES: hypothetical protein [unclassified Mesorhizobium]ESZ25353.1 hypothetical protein X734_20605 [Mesorhizobium sp. L2C084A000]RUW91683.1 hypothetical protein EOA19_14580 [Mesorhizobium sp. M7A.F.Ca.US.010.02.1.1]
MLKKIALAAVLVQVAAFSALITQTVLFASTATQAADAKPGDAVAVTIENERDKAAQPIVAGQCPTRLVASKVFTRNVITAQQ